MEAKGKESKTLTTAIVFIIAKARRKLKPFTC